MKTGGTSIEVFLSKKCGDTDVVTPIWPHVEPHRARNYQGLWNPFREIVKNRGRGIEYTIQDLLKKRKFRNHFSAALVQQRTPRKIWDSYFKFCVERNPWEKTLSHYHMLNDRAQRSFSFDRYIESRKFCINYHLYTDSKGLLLVDKVLKYESLMDDLGAVFKELGILFDGSLGVRAKSNHRKDRRPYQEVLSKQHRNVIEDAFAKEIAMHGYTF